VADCLEAGWDILKHSVMLLTFVAFVCSRAIVPAYSQATTNVVPPERPQSEEWAGVRTSGERSQRLVLHLSRSRAGSTAIDLPDFGALGIPASRFTLSQNHIHFELEGDTTTAVFDGAVGSKGIYGHWTEGEHSGNFTLARVNHPVDALLSKNMTIQNEGVCLSGTLLVPRARGPMPVVVFVHGAGPETRQASLFLAQFFAHRGVASFIYDKRGSGESTGDWKHSSFEDLAGDVVAVVKTLAEQPEIDPRRIGLMGSSQGGWIAPIAALHLPDLAFVIVKSTAAVTPERQELARVATSMAEQGASPADIAEGQSLYRNAIAYARSGVGWDALQREIKADSIKPWAFFPADTARDFFFFEQIRLFFAHEPIPVLERLGSPLLVIYGGKDDDGPPVQTEVGPLLTAMQSNGKTSQLAIFPDAGHDLRVVPGTGKAWDFGKFAPGYLDLLGTWVNDALQIEQATQ
jgi:pimeloyl-ACP methyl ester carboxylesterase